jgi:hypothetical protein
MTVLRELVSAKKERALDDPSVENVTTYIKVQKEAYDRSQRFTDAWQIAMYTDPKLDYASQHPTSTYGHSVEAEIKRNTEEQLLAGTADRVGLFFFFTSTCPFCQEQSKVLKVFADTYGLTVKPVSLDGVGLPEYPQPATQQRHGGERGRAYGAHDLSRDSRGKLLKATRGRADDECGSTGAIAGPVAESRIVGRATVSWIEDTRCDANGFWWDCVCGPYWPGLPWCRRSR